MLTAAAGQGDFFWEGQGFAVAYTFLFLLAMARGQACYWVARLVTEQALRHTAPDSGWPYAVHRWLSGDGVVRGRASLQRWGVVMVPLAYLTIGFQTLVLAAAGVLRIRWWMFSLVQIPGALAWAAIYSTIGFALWGATLAALAGDPLALAAILAGLLVVAASYAAFRRSRSRRSRVAPRSGANEDIHQPPAGDDAATV